MYRFKRGDADGEHFDEFDVPGRAAHDRRSRALRWIELNRDPSLALRHSCFHASCGTCGVQVERARGALACVTRDADHGAEMTVEPLANIPILTDLVVDMGEFYARFPDEHPIVRASEVLPDAQAPDGLAGYVRLEDCIECGLCLSACPVAADLARLRRAGGPGPAQRLLEEPRGADAGDVLAWASGPMAPGTATSASSATAPARSTSLPADRIMARRHDLTVAGHAHGKRTR